MSLATLSIDLVAQLASLQTGMDKAGRIAEKNASMIEARYKQMGAAAAALGTVLAGAFSVAGITAFVRSTVNGLDALNDLSDATGASIENLSALEDIAARTGTKMETVGAAVIKLNKTLADAKPGSEQEKALQAIGLQAAELRKLDPAEALLRVSVALANYADDGNKARLVQELLGKGVREMAPLLKDLADAGQLNATVTTAQAKAAEAFNQQLSRMGKNVTDVAREISGPLIGALNRLFERARQEGVLAALFTPTETGRSIEQAKELSNAITNVTNALIRADTLAKDSNLPGVVRSKWAADATALRTQLEGLQRQAFAVTDAMKGPTQNYSNEGRNFQPRKLPDLSGAGPTKALPKVAELPMGPFMPESLERALKLIDSVDSAKVAKLREELAQLISIRNAEGGGAVDEALMAVEEELAKLDPLQQQIVKNQARLNELLAATPQGKMASVLDEVAFINEQFSAGKIASVEQWAKAIRNATAKLPEGVQPELEKISTFAEQAGRNIQDALGDTLMATMSGSTKGIGRMWTDMLKRMATEAAAAQILKSLFGSSGWLGGALSLFAGLFGGGSGGGTIAGGSGIKFRAGGGPVSAGQPYIVGERGPELMIPRRGGTVVPNGALGGSSTFNVIVQGDASENTVRLVQGALAQFEARLMTRQRYA